MSELEVKAPGELLKIAREKLGLSINDVSLATKINPRILKALENGTKDDLPPKSFTRGFIRSYSSYLKISAEPIIEAYNLAEHVHVPEPGDLEKAKTEEAATPKVKPTISNRSKTITISGVIVLILIVIGVKQVFDKYSREADVNETPIIKMEPISVPEATKEPEAPKAATTDASTAVTATDASSSTKAPEVTPAETISTPDTAAVVKPAEVAAPVVTTPPIETPVAAVKPKVETPAPAVVTPPAPVAAKPVVTPETAKPTPVVAATTTTTPAVAEKKAEPANTGVQQEVMVEALDKVDLVIKTNEGTKKIQLQPEGIHTIKFNGKMSLEISDGGTVNLIHNGRDKGIPGDLGKSKTVQFP